MRGGPKILIKVRAQPDCEACGGVSKHVTETSTEVRDHIELQAKDCILYIKAPDLFIVDNCPRFVVQLIVPSFGNVQAK
jgi:hypothetical protein